MNPQETIYQNFPHCTEYRADSFTGILHEENRLDLDTYWNLEWALVKLTQNQTDYPRHLSWPVFRIFSIIAVKLMADNDPEDGYKIKNFSGEKSRDFTERFRIVFEGFFKGEMPDLILAFDDDNMAEEFRRNPLLE
jgi:hypothetical protein